MTDRLLKAESACAGLPATAGTPACPFLPRDIEKPKAPPLKCQGIKTRLTAFIARSIRWDGRGRWVEPFLGSGSVLFNLAPQRALIADSNIHIIQFYRAVQSGVLGEGGVRAGLEAMGASLEREGRLYYDRVRAWFNRGAAEPVPGWAAALRAGIPSEALRSLVFLFLNRCCFNGMMRFNSRGEFNVPFGHKPNRFSRAYVTRVVRQVAWSGRVMERRDWHFLAADWRETFSRVGARDFVYLDPPYIGRHTGYFGAWSAAEAEALAEAARRLPGGFAASMWMENIYRKNPHLESAWAGLSLRTFRHFYHVGATEALRNPMLEALLIKPGYLAG